MSSKSLLIFALLIFFASACGERITTQTLPLDQTDCVGSGGEVAHIRVSDGLLERECGCLGAGEAIGTIFTNNQSLTCTINRGAMVFFHYLGTVQTHQIISDGPLKFPSSPLSDPRDGTATFRVHAVKFLDSGNFQFKDAFNPSVGGVITVQ